MSPTRRWMLGGAATMIVGALALAPPVARYWSARLGADEREERPKARAQRPLMPAPDVEDVPARRPEPLAERSSLEEPPARLEQTLRALDPAESTAEGEPSAEGAAVPSERGAAPGPSTTTPPLPANHPALTHAAEAQAAADPTAEHETEATAPEEAAEPAPTRHVSISVLEARTQPGLCRGSSDAADARDALVARFHAFSWDGNSQLYVDPRLAPDAQGGLVVALEHAERELWRVLQLTPPRPDVFAYYDTELLLAAGCTNENVVAYYDGALHVVPSHEDVAQSILHEYTHHALMAAGVRGPAWAHEGIAMHMAGETWWKGGWMARVRARPFSLEVMESAVPYTLRSDQAGLFYAQSAAMVECSIRDDPQGLRGLVEALAAGEDRGQLSYQLPAAAAPLAWRACFDDLAR